MMAGKIDIDLADLVFGTEEVLFAVPGQVAKGGDLGLAIGDDDAGGAGVLFAAIRRHAGHGGTFRHRTA